MKEYLILYVTGFTEEAYTIMASSNIKDLIKKFADYHGDDSDLFELAITSLNDANDLVQMYNHFAYSNRITDIYELGKTIYTEDL